MLRGRLWLVVAVLCLATAPSAVMAHGMGVGAGLVDGKVVIKAVWTGGTPVKGAAVTLFDDAEQVLAEGKTDASGEFAWAVAETPPYLRIEVDAGQGHKGIRICTAKDLVAAEEPVRRVSMWTVSLGIIVIAGGTWLLASIVRRRKKATGE